MLPLRHRVKAASVANLTDARYFAAMGVHYLGFELRPGVPGAVSAHVLEALRAWVSGPLIVGELAGTSPETLANLARELQLDAVEVGPDDDVRTVKDVTQLPVLQRLAPWTGDPALLARAAPVGELVEAFVLPLPEHSLEASAADWKSLRSFCEQYPVLLEVPGDASSSANLAQRVEALGLQVRGGEEEAVGVKSFDELDELFEALAEPEY